MQASLKMPKNLFANTNRDTIDDDSFASNNEPSFAD